MQRIYRYFSLLAFIFSLYFGGLATLSFFDENMNKMYLNIGYCALFLSIMIYTFDMKKKENGSH
ncbi:protein YpmT [Bacillus sp. CLL-7-23]|uniref:Protein YpmT n=1 Tax=Bacillus changyiensis TaxID=3004103 RepID=A0ABT4X073_9BACI|nr:protein YpmT [Bacillus changyiensis]MDA7025700.1 protein YpmT [Bacillus changyiensis]